MVYFTHRTVFSTFSVSNLTPSTHRMTFEAYSVRRMVYSTHGTVSNTFSVSNLASFTHEMTFEASFVRRMAFSTHGTEITVRQRLSDGESTHGEQGMHPRALAES